MRCPRLLQVVVLLSCVVPASSACTGYFIGYAIDVSNKEVITPSRSGPPAIEPGKSIKLVLRNGAEISGEYLGLELLPAEDYAVRYAASRDSLAAQLRLPALGDTVGLLLHSGQMMKTEFLGCDYDGLWVRSAAEAEPQKLRLIGIREMLVRGGPAISGSAFPLLIFEGSLPTRSALALKVRGGRELVPLSDVARIERTPSKARWIGATTEFVISAATWAILLASWDW